MPISLPKIEPACFSKIIGLWSSSQATGLVLLALTIGFYLFGNSLLDNIELKTYDMRQMWRSAVMTEPAVTIAAIDEKSLSALGRWPWSRATMARLVEKLDTLGARVIAFDVFFSEAENRAALEQLRRLEQESGARNSASVYAQTKRALDTDTTFAKAIAKNGKVVLPMVFLMSQEEARHQQAADTERAFSGIQDQAIKLIRDRGNGRLDFSMPTVAGLVSNLPELTAAAHSVGHINIVPDVHDGSVREASLVLRYHELFFPAADVQAARLFLNNPTLSLRTTRYGISGLELGERFIPTDDFGRALINYRDTTHRFPTYSASDVLTGQVDPKFFRDKIVLVGATAQGLGDFRSTPLAAVFPGVEIRANIIQNLLAGSFIQRPSWMFLVDVGLMLLVGGVLIILLPRYGAGVSAGIALAFAIFYLLFALIEFRTQLIWINMVYALLLIILLYTSSTLIQYLTAEREKRQIKTAFQHYVPTTVVDQILRNIDTLGLGGEKRELTVLFADIRGFTGIAESLTPEALVQLLNHYLTDMTEQVFRHEGLLDKYIGDAILAVYGAPIHHPDHAKQACRTALDMLRAARRLQTEWLAQGLPRFDLGVGINTGSMVVGNMGSKTRFDYTVIGDAVNLGSRIETLNKQYGTHILISEFTYGQVKDEFPWVREIDLTPVRGRQEPVRLYELLLAEDYPNLDWLPEFHRAYELFRADLRVQARSVFEKLAEKFNDPVSRYYAERCQLPRRR